MTTTTFVVLLVACWFVSSIGAFVWGYGRGKDFSVKTIEKICSKFLDTPFRD